MTVKEAINSTLIVILLLCAATSMTKYYGIKKRNDAQAEYARRQMELVASDQYIRNRVVKLFDKESSCTGVIVRSKKGMDYILSAAHCISLVDKNKKVMIEDERGVVSQVSFIEEDPRSDLLLLTSNLYLPSGISISPSVSLSQKVHTMTRGGGHVLYRTDGELLEAKEVGFTMNPILTQADHEACRQPKNFITSGWFGEEICAVKMLETLATAAIVPGSSGGPLLDENNALVGIASATDGYFGYFVRLEDIQQFMSNR